MYESFCKTEIKINVIFNMVFNGVAGWVVFKPLNEVLLHNGFFGAAIDLLLTTVIIAMFVTLFPIISIKRKMKKNNLDGMKWEIESRLKTLISSMPERKIQLILLNILLALLVFYVPSFLFIRVVMDSAVSGDGYFIFKTLYCTALAMVVVYPVSYYAVTDRSSL